MENIRDIILGARAQRQDHMLKGFAPVPDDTEGEKVEKADNVFEKMADAIERLSRTTPRKPSKARFRNRTSCKPSAVTARK